MADIITTRKELVRDLTNSPVQNIVNRIESLTPVETFNRITEAGDARITEDGDNRITE